LRPEGVQGYDFSVKRAAAKAHPAEGPGGSDLRQTLRNAGLRVTSPRIAVLRELVCAKSALSHGEVAERLAAEFDRATVYRNLMDLTSAELVRRSDHGDHVWRFEFARQGGHENAAHPHFICGCCGTVTCLPEDAVSLRTPPGVPRALRRKKGVAVQLRGVCDACQ
jgi:Fur family ferric uptake transcriptional regulator